MSKHGKPTVEEEMRRSARLRNSGNLLVYLALERLKDSDGAVTVTLPEICRLTNLTKNTVIRHLKQLEGLGAVHAERGGCGPYPNTYVVGRF